MVQHLLPERPYSNNALGPYISAETLEYHHGKHHVSYIEKLNKQIQDTEFGSASLEVIIKTASGSIFNNSAQAWNHNFYWNCLSPDGGLADAINKAFNSVDEFKERFSVDYRNALQKYLEAFWNIVNRDFVAQNFAG